MKVKVRKHKKMPAQVATEQATKTTIELLGDNIKSFSVPKEIMIDVSLERMLKNAILNTISDNDVTHQVHTTG